MEPIARFSTNQPPESNRNGLLGLACLASLVACMAFDTSSAFGADWPTFRNTSSNAAASSETINLPLTLAWHTALPVVEENGAVVAGGVAYMSSIDGHLYAFTIATGVAVPGFPVVTAGSFGTPAVDLANGKVYQLAGSSLFAFNLNGSPAWTAPVGSAGTSYNQGPIIDGGFVYVKAGGNLLKYNSAGVQQFSVPCPGGNSQPAISGSFVYSNSEASQIQKFDKATGTQAIGGGFPISTPVSSGSSLTVADGLIFYKADLLYVYKISDGTLAWSKPDGGLASPPVNDSPAVSGGAVYTFGFNDSFLYAFDENTGATLPGFPSVALCPVGRNWASPSVAGDKVFIGAGTSQNLVVLGAAGTSSAGQVLASYPTFSADAQGFDTCSVVISGGFVFAMLDGGGLYAFAASGTTVQGGITINGGAACTTSANVVLSINNFGDSSITQMIISESPFFTGAVYEPYAPTKSWTLSAGFGLKTVYLKLKTSGGAESNVFSATIDYEATCQGGPTPTPTPPTPTGTPTPTRTPTGPPPVVPTLSTPMLALLLVGLALAALLVLKRPA